MIQSKKIIFAISAALLLGIGSSGVFYYKKSTKKLTLDDYIKLADEHVINKDFRKAYGNYVSASQFKNSPASTHWNAARIAIPMNWKNEALFHLNAAWRKGHKNANLIRLFFSLQKGFKGTEVRKALDMLMQLEDGWEKELLRGEIYEMNRNYNKALQFWKAMLKQKRDPLLINRIASVMIESHKTKEALTFLRHMEKLDNINEEGYSLLISLLFESRKFAESEQILKKAKSKGYYRPLLSFNYGKYLFIAGLYQDAETYLQKAMILPGIYNHDIKNKNEFIFNLKQKKNDIYGKIYNNLSGEQQSYINKYNYLDHPNPSILYGILETTLSILQSTTLDKDNNKVLTGPEIYIHNRNFLSEQLPELFPKSKETPFYYESNILLLYLYNHQNKHKEIDHIKIEDNNETPLAESLSLYKSTLEHFRNTKYDFALDNINKALTLIPDHPIFLLAQTDILNKLEKYDEALFIFQNIQRANPAYHFNAMFNAKWARTAIAIGNKRLALSIVSQLHNLQVYSPSTLAIYRDLKAELGDVDTGQLTQNFLSSQQREKSSSQWGEGILEFYRGNYKQSSDIFEELKQKSPTTKNYKLANMISLLAQGKHKEVIQQLDNIKNHQYQHHLLYARAYIGLNNIEKAARSYSKAVALKSSKAIVKEMSYFLISNHKLKEAMNALENKIKKQNKDAETYALQAFIYKLLKDWDKAKDYTREALLIDEYNLMAQMVLADIEWNNKNTKIALGLCDSILTRHPNYHPARYLAGLCYFKQKKFKRAKTNLKLVLNKVPNKRSVEFMICESDYQLKEYDSAINRLTNLIKEYPNYLFYQRRLIDFYLGKKDIISAEAQLNKIYSQLKEEERILLLAEVLVEKGELNSAINELFKIKNSRKAIKYWAKLKIKNKTFNGLDDSFEIRSFIKEDWITLGYQCEVENLNEYAYAYYKKALSYDQEDYILLSMFARIALNLGRLLPPTIEKVKASLEIVPGNLFIVETYVSILSKQKKSQNIIELLDKRSEAVLTSVALKYYLAEAYENTFELEKAIQYYEYCVSSKIDNWNAPKTKDEIQEKIKYIKDL